MRSIPITARGAEKLRSELQRLRGVDRPSIIQAIKDAREKGDLTENAEYDAARERQGFVEGRIQELEGKLSVLQIIDPATVDAAGRVVFGATVELEDQNSGDHVTYQIVGDDEADIKAGLISVSSPIARALIGKRVTWAGRPHTVRSVDHSTLLVELIQAADGSTVCAFEDLTTSRADTL